MTDPHSSGAPIGQLAVLRGLITQAQLDSALAEQERARAAGQRVRPLGEMLVAQEALSTAQLNALLQDVKLISSVSASSDEPAPFAKPTAPPASAQAPAGEPPAAAKPAEPAPAKPPAPAPVAPKAPTHQSKHESKHDAKPAPTPEAKPAPKKLTESRTDTPLPSGSSPKIPAHPSEADSKTRRKVAATPFGKYMVQREIGRGGKGVVQEALDTVLDRKVALKTIHIEAVTDAKEIEAEGRRFLAEARISASLPKHPHIVSVYEAGEIDGKRYLSMELIQGQSMMRWRRMTGISIAQQAALIRSVALALDEAHKAGVVHRDIKPQNILVDKDNQPHLTDWGLAKVTGQKEDLAQTVPGKVWGTPTYMSPEHARGLPTLDHRADVYSLGILLYESIAGRPPFRSDKPSEILDKLVREPVPPIGKFVDPTTLSPLQRDLEEVCIRALSKAPAERHASAREFAEDISRCLGDVQGAAKSKKMIWIGAAAAAVVLLAVLAFVFSGPSLARDLAEADRLLSLGKAQDAVAAYDRVLAHDASNAVALEGRKAAQKKVTDQHEAEKRRAADDARREERARAKDNEDELKARAEARRKADEEEAITQQARLMAEKRDAEERLRVAEEAKKKAEDKLNQPAPVAKVEPPAPAPSPTPAPTPLPPLPAPAAGRNPDPNGAAVVAPTGEPKVLEDGTLHFEAEDFSGGATPVANVDYHDTTPGNAGRAYRLQGDVDIGPLQEGGFFVGDINPGEWLHYTFQGGGRYQVEIRCQNRQGAVISSALHLEVDGVNVSGPITVPIGTERRGWGNVPAFIPSLPQGKHDLKVVFDARLDGLDYLNLKPFMPAPVPDSVSLRDSEKVIRDAFKGDYARKAPSDLQAFAKKLQSEAAKPQKEAALQYALLAETRDVAAQAGEIGIAMTAIEELDRTFAIDALTMKTETLATTMKYAKTPDTARGVAEAYGPVIEQSVDRDDYDLALLLCPKAETAAKNSQSSSLLAKVQLRTKEITALRDEYRNLKAALKTIQDTPADPAANLAVGLYRCFAKGDWLHGAALLAKGSDPAISALGQKEMAPPAETQAQVALADAWREAGEKRLGTLKTRLLTRALHWYEKALPDIPGLLRVKVEGYIETITKAVYGGTDILRRNLVFWVEPGREPTDPYREHVSGGKAQNNGSTIITDSGTKVFQFNIGQQNRGWIEYPASDTVKSIDKAGSVFAWIKTDILDYWGGIVNRGGVNDQYDDFGLWVARGNVGAWFNYPDNRRRMNSKGTIASGKWTLVGVAWDERNATFFIDGKEEGGATLTAAELPQRRTSRISIGSNPPGGQDPYNGLVGSVMIYNKPLTAPEASLLYLGTRLKFK
ncbi:MAG TPA: protein kinase [Planctomycetota bacterium]|nr:protein kinase [Planctomycetota bacterium]